MSKDVGRAEQERADDGRHDLTAFIVHDKLAVLEGFKTVIPVWLSQVHSFR